MRKSGIILVFWGVIVLTPVLSLGAGHYSGTNHYYQYFDAPDLIQWSTARDSAYSLGGYLATITSQDEQDFISALIPSGTIYTLIGGHDSITEGVWQWITDEPFIYTNWHEGEPNSHYGDGDDFLMMFSDGTWNDGPDWSETGFMVEWDCHPDTNIVRYVPSQYSTIQDAIDSSCDGDTVLIADGIYIGEGNRDVSLQGKAILILSENGPESTIIDCEGSIGEPHRGFIFNSDEDSLSIIDGITIQNGYGPVILDVSRAGAIALMGSSEPVIRNCRFLNNSCSHTGGAICVFTTSSPTFDGCLFQGNTSQTGGAVNAECGSCDPHFYNCIFEDNTASFGGAVFSPSAGLFDYCMFMSNFAGYGAALFIGDSTDISNCLIIGNYGNVIYGASTTNIANSIICFNNGIEPIFDNGIPIISCSNIYGNESGDWVGFIADQYGINGNISQDPLFCDTANGDYHLFDNSPCLPENNDCGTLIGVYGLGCDNMITAFGILNEDDYNVVSHTPVFYWSYYEPLLYPEDSFEIAVGIDDDWSYAEMWNPAPFIGPDTSILYAGSPLEDGDIYHFRVRVFNGETWSIWYDSTFRMNSVPSIPMALQPIDEDVCVTNQPTLSLTNSFDAEGDTLVYDYMAVVDTAFGEPELYQGEDIPEGEDSTGWQINESLHENWRYWWRARAFDGYEYSDWSESEMFWINAVEEAPDTFRVYYPPDTSSGIVYDMLPDFIWSGSHDNDPFDSVHYSLYLSTDSEFVFFNQIDSIWESFYTLTDSLYFGTKFYWKMKAIDNAGQFTYSNNVLSFRTWKLGDANDDWEVNLLDILALIDCLYGEGNCPEPVIASDVNGDCNVNLLDVLYLISYLYGNPPGAAPVVGCE